MALRFLEQKEINRKYWDDCVTAASQHKPYAWSWYLDLVAENWAAVVEESDAGYAAVFPLPWKRKLGIRHVYSPFFCQQLGLFGSSKHLLNDFLKAIPSKFVRVQLQIQCENKEELTGLNHSQKPNYVLDLQASYEQIRAGYAENTRRNIKKAEKAALSISTDWDAEWFMDCLRTNQGPGIPELGEEEYDRIQTIITQALALKRGSFVSASDKEGQIAGIFTIEGAKGPVYLFGTTNQRARTTGAMPFAFNHIIRERAGYGADAGAGMLDFEGSSIPGLARFYRGFGAVDIPYYVIRKGI